MKKGPFKLKGFSGFGEGTSPVKNVATSRNKSITPDAVLLEAAGQMKRGIDEGIAGSKGKARGYYAGMGALGFLDGLSKIKPRTQSDEDKKRQEEEKKTKKIRKEGEKAWKQDDKRRKKKKEKKPVITVEPPTVESIDGKKTKGKKIIERIFKRKKKK
jgi:hypothetical protein